MHFYIATNTRDIISGKDELNSSLSFFSVINYQFAAYKETHSPLIKEVIIRCGLVRRLMVIERPLIHIFA